MQKLLQTQGSCASRVECAVQAGLTLWYLHNKEGAARHSKQWLIVLEDVSTCNQTFLPRNDGGHFQSQPNGQDQSHSLAQLQRDWRNVAFYMARREEENQKYTEVLVIFATSAKRDSFVSSFPMFTSIITFFCLTTFVKISKEILNSNDIH